MQGLQLFCQNGRTPAGRLIPPADRILLFLRVLLNS